MSLRSDVCFYDKWDEWIDAKDICWNLSDLDAKSVLSDLKNDNRFILESDDIESMIILLTQYKNVYGPCKRRELKLSHDRSGWEYYMSNKARRYLINSIQSKLQNKANTQ